MSEQINEKLNFQPYNSNRSSLVIPEYGRNVQRMIEYALTLEDREERNRCVRAILSVMGQLFPHLRDIEDFNHKLWDHLHIISKFKLDVDSPYPRPDAVHLESKPERIPYPNNDIKFGHYGIYVERFIAKCSAMEEGPEKQAFAIAIANLMKYNAFNWNRNTVHDDVILKDLANLSKGKIILTDASALNPIKAGATNKFKDFEDSLHSGKKFKSKHGHGPKNNMNMNKKKKFKRKP